MTSGPDFGSADDEASRLTRFIGEVGIWSVDPYQRCSFRCVYCIADSQGESTPRHSAGRVVAALRRDLEAVPPEAELFIGATADAYPPVERELGLTRLVLAEVSRQGRPFCVATKGTLVLRDIDILRDHGGHCDVYLSLATLDDEALRRLEPGAPSAGERLDAIRALHDAGVDVHVEASPWIPGVSRAEELLAALPSGVGVKFVPLDTRRFGETATILGRRFSQTEILDAYGDAGLREDEERLAGGL